MKRHFRDATKLKENVNIGENFSQTDTRKAKTMKITALAVCIAALAAIAGCRGTGTYAHVGDVTAPVEVSDSSDTINVRALFSMRGAKVWSAKDSIVAMTYTNDYTNSYLYGMVETRGRQNFGVDVNPCEVAPPQP